MNQPNYASMEAALAALAATPVAPQPQVAQQPQATAPAPQPTTPQEQCRAMVEQLEQFLRSPADTFDVGQTLAQIRTLIDAHPFLADWLRPEDIGTMVAALRNHYNVQSIKVAKGGGGGSGSRSKRASPKAQVTLSADVLANLSLLSV